MDSLEEMYHSYPECRVCTLESDASSMLLCAVCGSGTHVFCLTRARADYFKTNHAWYQRRLSHT